jgi:hypothetical protein
VDAVLAHLTSMSASGVDSSIRQLGMEVLREERELALFVDFVQMALAQTHGQHGQIDDDEDVEVDRDARRLKQLRGGANFELVQAYLAVFLKVFHLTKLC